MTVACGALACALGAGCDDAPRAPSTPTASAEETSAPTAAATASGSPAASARGAATASATTTSAAATATASASGAPATSATASDEPLEACGVGLAQLPFTGPAALVREGDDVRVVFNDKGVARAATVGAAPDAGTRAALDGTPTRATSPACARAATAWFCAEPTGTIHRQSLGGDGDKVVAQGRPGAPLAAAELGGGHAVVAFLADRKTTEGAVTLAFAAVDDAPPTLLSEEGSGATYVALAPHDGKALAAYVDARRAMTPVHARELSIDAKGKLTLGKDAVPFVGEGSDARTPCALVGGGDSLVGLVPIGDGAVGFGMASVRIGATPSDDAPTSWSRYPNGCTPAPLAATRAFPAKVARARPSNKAPDSRRVLELGDLDAAGGFTSRCAIADAGSFSDVSIEVDGKGVAWIAFTDGKGTWLARHDARAKKDAKAPKRP
ncbi:MAG TPA: hypothetical protein VGM56_15755 [Byssovorax sp.]